MQVNDTGKLCKVTEPTDSITTWLYEVNSFVPCGKIKDGEHFSIVSNYLGTPEYMYSSEGELVWHGVLDIYGRIDMKVGKRMDCPFRYQGQYDDLESGLYYNRFRYYNPDMGMYVSQDPIGLNSRNYNLYSYVRDTNRITGPFGLDWVYILEDSKGKPYYVGRAGDDMSLMDVARRHNATEGTIDGARFGEGDTLKRKTDFDIKPDPVRGLEQIGIDDTGGKIGRSQEFRRGNNIDGISERKRKKADGKKRMKQGREFLNKENVKKVTELPTLEELTFDEFDKKRKHKH